ncbi:hypothetical protein BABINDRAFT_163724 [Babjeviella inositovora NRRL Y-12698]|uniref:Secreted protein n=1 Tax=Babjeviella inositovora NRRL Y-12698 TaxID=984486 RepID=A0A1E3QJG2_9ASCO|nr:uncharacterized protein BABINDRAFT_163724 [Babjeviella inositovora NRRL Y-12698]ODQ77222.1 hypothetical protein BABINDRAFT_163724 [Babjeviella inositovora NRRL Y-12698]
MALRGGRSHLSPVASTTSLLSLLLILGVIPRCYTLGNFCITCDLNFVIGGKYLLQDRTQLAGNFTHKRSKARVRCVYLALELIAFKGI